MISLTAIICVLFSIGTISAQEMWGSRIITTPSGPEKEMKFAYETGNVFGVFEGEEYKDLTIEQGEGEEGKCKVDKTDIGSPCSTTENTATISFDNVEKYKAFTIGKSEGKIPIVAAYMVPDCKFEETLTGKVDLKTSAPLTRFVKGQKEVELDFGLKPGDENLESTLYRNGIIVCSWTGKKVKVNNLQSCKDLVPSEDDKLWIARVTFSKEDDFAKDNYLWTIPTSKSFLTVSVDWDNEGVAPEVAECEKNGETLIPTEPTPIPNDPSTSESTTSAGRKGQEYGAITLGTLALFAIAKLF